MRLYFDIDDDWCDQYGYGDLKKEILDGVVSSIVHQVLVDGQFSPIQDEARRIIKDSKAEIVDRVVEVVTDTILKKQEIKSLAPTLTELKNADAQVVKYFEDMVDKAIAKRFR